MISGFVICMSGWGRRPGDFFVSRVVRLYPAYWAAIGLTAVALTLFPRLTSGIRLSMILTNLSMVQSAYGVPNLDPAFWTLFIELKFYILFGLVAIGGITYRRMAGFCVLWSVASIFTAQSRDVASFIVSPRYSMFFIAGIAFYLIHRFGSNLLLWGIVAFNYFLAINNPRPHPRWEVTLLITIFFVAMSLIALHLTARITWRWLTVAGTLTYPLYLIHQNIGFTIIAYLRGHFPPLVLAAGTYVAMLVLAYLIHRLVERPVAPWVRKKLTQAVQSIRALPPDQPSGVGLRQTRPARQRPHIASHCWPPC